MTFAHGTARHPRLHFLSLDPRLNKALMLVGVAVDYKRAKCTILRNKCRREIILNQGPDALVIRLGGAT